MSNKWKLWLIILALSTLVVWLSVFATSRNNLKIVNCNVGQGDATLIVFGSNEILIDGGPDNKVLDCLSRHMPFWDRNIETVILTHPQSDHYMGLIGVLERYNVENILANSLNAGSQGYTLLKKLVIDRGIKIVNPTSGMLVRSQMIQLDILHPSSEFLSANFDSGETHNLQSDYISGVLGSSESDLDPNEFSVIVLLKFGSFRFLFTGDATNEIMDAVASSLLEKGENPVNYIKIPHHGSDASLSEKLYDLSKSGIAVISVGRNSYGHPGTEVMKRLNERGIKVFRTDETGDVMTISDGKRIWTDI